MVILEVIFLPIDGILMYYSPCGYFALERSNALEKGNKRLGRLTKVTLRENKTLLAMEHLTQSFRHHQTSCPYPSS